MTRSLAVCGTLLAASLLMPTLSRGGQEEQTWEFSAFGGKVSLDNADPLALVKTARGDFDFNGDGTFTDTTGVFRRSLDLKNDSFLGVRLGFNWTKNVESELVYDRNHTGASYRQSIDEVGSDLHLPTLNGRIGTILTSYQIGVLYHPLGKWKTAWQPYVTVAGGYIDVDFVPSTTLKERLNRGAAGSVFGVDFAKQDNGVMVGYGVGLKYYLADNVAIRVEARGKSYELFDEQRTDRELSLGISFFAPGQNW